MRSGVQTLVATEKFQLQAFVRGMIQTSCTFRIYSLEGKESKEGRLANASIQLIRWKFDYCNPLVLLFSAFNQINDIKILSKKLEAKK